ncbi:NXPE family member 3-like isoform X1 [Leucoraja erinacea]|uniref:NXPE family member 3-like isoform X1 n=2 Tax=Leucoraja erinaceus TaxID=7782 RepID=UPI002456A42A|nr:NXPE family member 3-like isoform X1 [Leucoraja erinacea]
MRSVKYGQRFLFDTFEWNSQVPVTWRFKFLKLFNFRFIELKWERGGPSSMDDQNTKKTVLHFRVQRLFVMFLVLLPILMLILNLHLVKFNTYSISESGSQRSRYPPPKNHSTIGQDMQMLKNDWAHKLVGYGYQNHCFTPQERSEGTVLIKMLKWPTPPKSAVPYQKSSDPSRVRFVILDSGKTFYVGDQLQVMLRMFDFEGNPKQYGGDYLQARIHTPELNAGSAGTVIDNQNGLYYINFILLWPGKVQVSVTLVHSIEGVQVLQRMREEQPFRVFLKSTFKYGAIADATVCNLFLPQTKPLCNFTDLKTGEPWFCYKPKKLPCSARVNYDRGGYMKPLLIHDELKFFQRYVARLNNEKLWLEMNEYSFLTIIFHCSI